MARSGGALGLVPIGWSVVGGFIVLAEAALVAFVALAGVARKETAAGLLVPIQGAVRVAAPRPATIARVNVAEGDAVAAGQTLFLLETRRTLEGGRTLDTEQRETLERQAALLSAQIESARALAELNDHRLAERIAFLSKESDAIAAQREMQAERGRLAQLYLQHVQPLRARGLLSEAEYRTREDQALALIQGVAQLGQQETALRRDLADSIAQRARLPAETADQVDRLQHTLAEVQMRRTEAEIAGAEVVRAPVAGRVSAIYGRVGQAATPDRPVLTLLPPESGLRAELFVPARAIGFIAPGQQVRLRYEAFPYQQFGVYGGRVESIASTLLAPEDVAGPIRPKEPSYRVLVALDRATVRAFGRDVPLQPEMSLSADIVLERRTWLTWFLQPVFAMQGGR